MLKNYTCNCFDDTSLAYIMLMSVRNTLPKACDHDDLIIRASLGRFRAFRYGIIDSQRVLQNADNYTITCVYQINHHVLPLQCDYHRTTS